MNVFISDSLKARLDNLFDKENFQIWMDDFDEEDFPKHYFLIGMRMTAQHIKINSSSIFNGLVMTHY